MSFGYKVSEKLTVTLDWVNANNSIYHDAFGGDDTNFPRDTRRYDETVELGLRWHMLQPSYSPVRAPCPIIARRLSSFLSRPG